MVTTFKIQALNAWSPRTESSVEVAPGHQASGFRWENSEKYTPTKIPKNHARRMSTLSKLTVGLAIDATEGNDLDHAVFSTRYGELENTVALVKMITEGEELSPTKFSQSVHNTSSGLFSILSKSKVSMEAVSAAENSFLMGFISAVAYLKANPNSKVLFVYSDIKVPDLLYSHATVYDRESVGVAMLLTNHDADAGLKVKLETQPRVLADEKNKQSQAQTFLQEILVKRGTCFSIIDKSSEWKFDLL